MKGKFVVRGPFSAWQLRTYDRFYLEVLRENPLHTVTANFSTTPYRYDFSFVASQKSSLVFPVVLSKEDQNFGRYNRIVCHPSYYLQYCSSSSPAQSSLDFAPPVDPLYTETTAMQTHCLPTRERGWALISDATV